MGTNSKAVLRLYVPMTKKPDLSEQNYVNSAGKIMSVLDEGKNVAFLTLGDPTVYSTYIYVHRIVSAAGYSTEIISGITSFCAAAARLNDSIADRIEQIQTNDIKRSRIIMDNIDITSVLNSVAGVLISLLIFAGVSFLFSLISFAVLKRHPKTYIFANLPVIIYPYAYILVALLAGQGAAVTGQSGIIDFILPVALVLLFLLIHPMCLAAVIVNFRAARINLIPAGKFANGILLVKLIHIPAFILHFILGSLGVLASVWGLGIIMFAVLIDLLTVIGSGTYTAAAITGLCRQNVINKWTGVLFGILSYIYCVDVAAAIALKVIVNKKLKSENCQE